MIRYTIYIRPQAILSEQEQKQPLDSGLVTYIERIVEQVAEQFGLNVTMKSTLASVPDSMHWHLKKGRQAGVLEVTFAVRESELWVETHENRKAEWNMAIVEPFTHQLESVVTVSS